MKNLFFLLFFITSTTTIFAQFGIRGTYSRINASGLESAIEDNFGTSDFNFNSIGVGVDYWFRLKNRRVEFMPTLNYSTSSTEIAVQADGSSRVFDLNAVGVRLNTHFYFLDFKGDCDCPTWSKSEPWVEKGLFLFLSPGVDYQRTAYTVKDQAEATLDINSSDLNFNIGAGLGLDIGLSDLITLTPYAGVRFHQSADWGNFLFDFELPFEIADQMTQLYGGLRLGIRLED